MKSLLFLLGLAAITAQAQPAFRAGVSAIDITPKTFPRIIAGGFLEGRGDKIADRLHVRSFVLDDGKMKIAFAIVDTCMMEQTLIDEAKALASKQCGIPVDRMMVSATHTHSAPAAMGCLGTRKDSEYGNFLTPKIAEAIVAADKALQPARIGWGSFDDWEHTHNRRWIRLPGKEVVDPFGNPTGRANMHPGYLSKDVVGPSGPVDPQLSVISMQTIDGKPLGVLANYSQHYFGSGPISSDYYGLFCKHLAAKLSQQGEGNGPFVCAMSQGTSGDLMWMDYGAEKKNITLDEYASAVAESAMQALKTVKYHDHVPLRMVEKTLELNYRVPDEKRLAWARPIAAKIKNDVPKNKEEVYAREALILHERQKTSVKLQAIRIGDLSIATLPNEVYAITGLKLKKFSPAKSHFNIELANGAEGYIPPPEQHKLGGYTTWPARTAGLEVLAEPKSVQTLLGALEEVTGQKRRSEQSENGPYAKDIIASKPVAYWRLDEISTDYSLRSEVPILKRPGGRDLHFAVSTSRCAMYLPGVGSGSGCGDQEKLRSSPFSGPEAINRCVHVAGGEIDGYIPALGDHHSVALWFWAGRLVDIGDKPETELFRSGIEWVHLSNKRGKGWHLTIPGPSGADGTSPRSIMLTGADPTAIKHGSTVISENSWHFLVYSKKGNETTVFLDGKKEMSTELEPAFKESRKVDVSMLAFGQSFEGKIDEIAVWDRVIEPEFIEQLWETSKMEEANERDAAARLEKAKQARAQTSTMLKGHENWSASLRFRNTKANDASPVTAYLISRGPKGDHQAPGDHLGIGGSYKDSLPGRLFVYNGNAANQIVRGQTLITPASWNEVKLERQGSHVKVMLNGKVEIDAELPVTAPGATELFFGRRCDDFAPLEGEFADVAVTGLEKPAAAAPKPQVELASQPLGPEESAKKWHVREGYRIDLVAAEPVVLDPVAFDWDDKGRLWVIEMADYPLGMDGNGKAGGRVVMLEDTNSDGRYDKRTVIVNDLSYPTGILTWRDGVIVTAAPDIFFIKPSGEKQVLYTGFSTGNQQLRVNGLRWGMDSWVYCAAGAHHGGYNKGTQIECKLTGQKIDLGSRDFRFKPDTGEFDPQSGPSQFGRAHDDWGHWFGVQNSFPLWHYVLQDHYLRRNPYVIPPDPVHQLFPRNPPVYPASSMEKRFHSFDQAGRFTSACGIEVYRDRVLFGDGKTHAFTCEPFHNVVQHHVLEDDGVTFKASRDPAESKMDFLASEDRWCRPVMVRTGPDGALWVADMYRYMIEHPQWLPQNGKDELLPHYREGDDKGRIWKVVRISAPSTRTDAGQGLASANGWQRDKAQMQVAWENRKAETNDLLQSKQPQTRAQAAWASLSQGRLTTSACLQLLEDESPHVREQALQMAEHLKWKGDSAALQQALAKLLNDKDEKVQLQLACTLGELRGDWAADLLAELLRTAPTASPLQGAALSSILPHLERVCTASPESDNRVAGMLFRCALAVKNETALAALLSRPASQKQASEFLAVLDENGLSLAQFTKQTTSPAAQQGLKQMSDMLAKAAAALKTSQTSPPMADLELLASDREHREMVKALLPELWQKSADAGVLRLVTRLQPKSGPEFLLAGWNERTPAVRMQILETLLSNDGWTLALLRRPEAKGCDAATRARLIKHPKKEIAKLASAVFEDASSSTRTAVVEKFKPALKLKGDAARGKTTFAQVCISCHKLDGVGIELGPDLRSVVQHDAEKLLNSILDPSAIIEPGFMAYHCTLKNGEQLYGVIATETSASLTLKMAGNMTKSVLRSDIAKLQSTGASLMPEGLEAALTPQTLADLIAYLQMPK
ncbi:neutral/alkaline non-lysosomal ceramidase N-terminal domain-containing protein [Prosthecobacter vanneervenii]|uniref:Putative membrane-bound dehydrogenase-like protein n=2 Tax=Prosthecobacter vanneervenii TaxID=48466 RepID=A0A7W7YEK9_9BACT|nr:neutral/alkaline non-lysosomal ceramidase N-terminal domain-containing protein [Prosthecobacter vanneervenii]MBB5034780.1 putative membrane-bound dehydrogenase-like protein [Prosthecobacter vanneervenii]